MLKTTGRFVFVVICTAVLTAVVAPNAHADPIRVTGGQIGLLGPTSEPASAQLVGAGLSLSGDGFGSGLGPVQLQPGDVGRAFGSFDFSSPHAVDVMVNGTAFTALLVGGLSFASAAFVLPQPTGNSVSYRVPFTMTGRLRGFSEIGGTPLFDVDLFGAGTLAARQSFVAGFGSDTGFGGNFQFEDASPSPTPEPTSLLLLGSGVAGLVVRYRKRM